MLCLFTQIFRGSDAFYPLEDLGEGAAGGKTRGEGDLLEFEAGVGFEYLTGVVDAQGVDELVERLVGTAGDDLAQVGLVGVEPLYQVVHREVVFEEELLFNDAIQYLGFHVFTLLLGEVILVLRVCPFLFHVQFLGQLLELAVGVDGVDGKPDADDGEYGIADELGYGVVKQEVGGEHQAERQGKPLDAAGELDGEVALVGVFALVHLAHTTHQLTTETVELEHIE